MEATDEAKELKQVLRSLVVSSPTRMDALTLLRDYRSMQGAPLPYSRFGYRDAVQFLRERCADCFLFQGSPSNPTLTLIVPEQLKHIDEFVQRQKVSSTVKHKGKRRSVQDYNSYAMRTGPPDFMNNSYSRHSGSSASGNNRYSWNSGSSAPVNNSYSRNSGPSAPVNNNYSRNSGPSAPVNNGFSKNSGPSEPDINSHSKHSGPSVPDGQLKHSEPDSNSYSKHSESVPDSNNYSKHSEFVPDSNNYSKHSEPSVSETNGYSKNYGPSVSDSNSYSRQSSLELQNVTQKRLPSQYQSSQTLDRECSRDGDSAHTSDSSRRTGSSNSSTKRLQLEQLKSEVRQIVADSPDGVWCTALIKCYRERFGRELDFSPFGCTSILAFMSLLEDEVVVSRASHAADWLLRDRRAPAPAPHPLATPRAAARTLARQTSRPSSRLSDDALPGIDFDPDVYPEDCMHYLDSIPCLSLADVRRSDMLAVQVGEVYSPSHFWLIRLGEEHNLAMENIMDELAAYYTSGEGRERVLAAGAVCEGQYCSALYENDWHRALIVSVVDCDTVKVRHVDYGTVDRVPTSLLRPLPRRWGSLPAQAVRARLAGVRPAAAGRRWPHAAAQHFLRLVEQRQLVANVVAVEQQEGILETLLIDTSTDIDLNIGDELIRAGHADPRHDSALHAAELYLFPLFEALESGAAPNYAEVHAYLRDGIALDYVDAFRRHVPASLSPPPHAAPDLAALCSQRAPSPTPPPLTPPIELPTHMPLYRYASAGEYSPSPPPTTDNRVPLYLPPQSPPPPRDHTPSRTPTPPPRDPTPPRTPTPPPRDPTPPRTPTPPPRTHTPPPRVPTPPRRSPLVTTSPRDPSPLAPIAPRPPASRPRAPPPRPRPPPPASYPVRKAPAGYPPAGPHASYAPPRPLPALALAPLYVFPPPPVFEPYYRPVFPRYDAPPPPLVTPPHEWAARVRAEGAAGAGHSPPPPYSAAEERRFHTSTGDVTLSADECRIFQLLSHVDANAAHWYMVDAIRRASGPAAPARTPASGPASGLNPLAREFRVAAETQTDTSGASARPSAATD